MNQPADNASARERIEHEAVAWVLRRDRGLTPVEQDAFSAWLAADPRHGPEFARFRGHWRRVDRLAEWRPEHGAQPNPDLLAPPLRRRVVRFVPAAIALAAAAAAIGVFLAGSPRMGRATNRAGEPQVAALSPAAAAPALPANQRVLEDGTIVELNRDAEIAAEFSARERRVTLVRGEAHFAVTKDPARPFVVRAGGVDVRAVGTAFNVRIDPATVEVLVTEGRVQLETNPVADAMAHAASGGLPAEANAAADAANAAATMSSVAIAPRPILEARQRAVVSLAGAAPAPQIDTLTAGEVERVLAWQHRLLDFRGVPLAAVVAEFNRRNVVQLVLIDPELAATRVTATLRSDNIDAFVRLLEQGFNARAERRGATEILLRAGR